jgi:isoamylase
MVYEVLPGENHPLGATVADEGVNFCLFSEHANQVELLVFDKPEDLEPVQVVLLDPEVNRTYSFWHVFLKGLKPGAGYAYRVDGPHEPHNGHRFDRSRVLIDPYARANTQVLWDRGKAIGEGDNLKTSLRSVVVKPPEFNWKGDRPLDIPKQDTIIYEMHVGGFTKSPTAKVKHPGKFLGVVEKIPYLKELGVTAVELLPVAAFDETEGARKNKEGQMLKNYWGYAPVGFFSLHPAYCVAADYGEQINEFKTMVRELHKNGIEVILDMVYNHTSEGNELGPTFCFRGLDNAVYYHLRHDDGAQYVDFSGCGNSINANHPIVAKMIKESLEYWAGEMHVDGFRLDEGSVLSRNQMGQPDRYPQVLWEIELSEALADTKLFSEAWDAKGLYEIGSFPGYRWSEWNGRYRDAIRRFVRGDNAMVGEAAARIAGSADLYQAGREQPINSVNFITCHDGFTLWDLVSYNGKHNEANGEDNRDGIEENYSWNGGAEGETELPAVWKLRRRQARNLLTILLLSQGVPMLLAGDECGQTQRGNNNAYCQDNELSWFDWERAAQNGEMAAYVQALIEFRKSHRILRRRSFFSGKKNERGLADLEWHGALARQPGFADPLCKVLGMSLGAEGEEPDVLVLFNMQDNACEFELVAVDGREWRLSLQTSEEEMTYSAVQATVPARTVAVFESV